MKNKKQKVLNYLFSKLDTIKLEIFNIQKHKNDFLNLYDFEKDSRLVEHEHKLVLRNRKEKKKEQDILNEVKKYLMEIKLIPVSKILCQTHKVIFYDEYVYLIKEYEINKDNFLKEGKKNKLIREIKSYNNIVNDNINGNIVNDNINDSINDSIINNINGNTINGNHNIVKDDININNIIYSNINDNYCSNNLITSNNSNNINKAEQNSLKIKKALCHKELIRYFKLKEMFLTDNIKLMPKNTNNTFLFLEKIDTLNLQQPPDQPLTSLKSYKDKISIFKECHSQNSKFYKFTKALHMTGCHQSFRKTNEKFVFSNMRDLTRNINKLTDYQNINLVYNQENNRTQNEDNLEEETYENFYQTEIQENNEGLEKYPFYGDQ